MGDVMNASRIPPPICPSDWDTSFAGNPQLPAQVTVDERAPDKVLYGPRGEVLLRLEDRKRIGFA